MSPQTRQGHSSVAILAQGHLSSTRGHSHSPVPGARPLLLTAAGGSQPRPRPQMISRSDPSSKLGESFPGGTATAPQSISWGRSRISGVSEGHLTVLSDTPVGPTAHVSTRAPGPSAADSGRCTAGLWGLLRGLWNVVAPPLSPTDTHQHTPPHLHPRYGNRTRHQTLPNGPWGRSHQGRSWVTCSSSREPSLGQSHPNHVDGEVTGRHGHRLPRNQNMVAPLAHRPRFSVNALTSSPEGSPSRLRVAGPDCQRRNSCTLGT